MIRKVASVTLCIIAGFFFYGVGLLGFVDGPSIGAKYAILIGLAAPAVIALCGGLALTRFRNWKRDTGIVLLSASGFTAFLMLSLAYFFTLEDFRKLMPPDTTALFSDYFTGSAVVVSFAVLGLVLLKMNKNVEAAHTSNTTSIADDA